MNSIQFKLRAELLQQAQDAFAKLPDLSGVVHGYRRIAQGARGRRTALFPSRKNGITVALESQLELAYCLLLERDAEVIGYRCQAINIQHGQGKKYTPDFLVLMANQQWLVREIKPNQQHLDEENKLRFLEIKNILNLCDFHFSIVDSNALPSKKYLENLYFFYSRSSFRAWSSQELVLARQLIASLSNPMSLGDVYTASTEAALSPFLVDYLLFHRVLVIDMSRPLSLDMPVGVLQ
ncbi:hypothetical protein [Janthinobacterium sp. B9-8]|uniref:hypothetical protein n=1 Tax=Janthinobacterium sp. B9-8 TaxID=1236179 RepID=UPI00069BF4F6|nr:hypothetical protein [Janthinobacterium sp. B9-8]AMC35285.1 hypothetical protein VN23_12035 [Janthinobacterium sp. B9-8]